ncbi:MAG: rRNA maturation RNase YbeY [Patescibacteria group bacterium]|jgi:probable rRNA maturation factor
MLNLNIITSIPANLKIEEQELGASLEQYLHSLGVTKKVLIEIGFVRSDTIHKLNKQHRNIDKPTDVLSFPQADVPAGEVRFLGSIIICPKIVRDKEEEMDDVIKHGLLHLLGFDHETDEQAWSKAARKINCQL